MKVSDRDEVKVGYYAVFGRSHDGFDYYTTRESALEEAKRRAQNGGGKCHVFRIDATVALSTEVEELK
jgi:hypothetical protein